jgi:putative endonuclease
VTGARRALGDTGEELAANRYTADGYDILDRNWRCSDGELDLVAARGPVLVFCEVKTRRSQTFGAPFEAVTPTKQRRLRRLALRWLSEHPQRPGEREIRFDVASVSLTRGAAPVVEVIEQAF